MDRTQTVTITMPHYQAKRIFDELELQVGVSTNPTSELDKFIHSLGVKVGELKEHEPEPKGEDFYRVEYFYLATGMEGIPDQRIEGTVLATSPDEAKDKILNQNYGHMSERDQQWVKGCLSAHRI